MVRPETWQEVGVSDTPTITVHVLPPGNEVTTYDVIGSPLSAAAVHETDADWSPLTATTSRGLEGVVAGVTVFVTADAVAEVPTEFIDTTVKEYAVPLVRPVTVQLVEAVLHVKPPASVEVTM